MLLGQAKYDLANFVDENSTGDLSFSPSDNSEKIWNMAYGPNGFLVFSTDEQKELDSELKDVTSTIELDIINIKTPDLKGTTFSADKSSDYAAQINMAVDVLGPDATV